MQVKQKVLFYLLHEQGVVVLEMTNILHQTNESSQACRVIAE